ncbi:MAG: flavodoxin family protein [Candidatus Omnitrophica bacterium]|nr:flavodoxin family protein [Candidatus Omnitrophota bacterium]
MKMVVLYYSRGGTTQKMAQIIRDALKEKGADADLFSVEQVKAKELLEYDGIIIGSPTYYGTLASEVKKLLDDTVSYHGKFDGKVGAAFSASANIGGGNETTVISILEAMLIHGMIIQGDPKGDHYGPTAVGGVDDRVEANCVRLAERVFDLLESLK